MTVDKQILSNPELRERIVGYALDALWGMIESNSLSELDPDGLDGNEEWMDLGPQAEDLGREVSLLAELGLLGVHPEHPTWVREITEL
jgi:hypothetical protein